MDILLKLNSIYETRKFKILYTVILTGLSVLLLLIIPFFIERNVVSSFWFDLLIRVIITYWFYLQFHFVSHLDQYYDHFYKGARKPIFTEPDVLKELVNILAAIFSGGLTYIFSIVILRFFIPNIGITGTIISVFFGVFTFLPLLSQYKKR